jgi:DNA-binding LacI/PurR family transcriptional regulator
VSTLREVAERAGVSLATASRVAAGSQRVRPETRERVELAMRELLYVRPGRRAESGTIGLLVPELANPVFPAFAHAIESRAAALGLACILCNTAWSAEREAEYAHMLIDRRVDGMIFVSSQITDRRQDHALFDRLLDRRFPIVFVNELVAWSKSAVVLTDERLGTSMATEHLLELGHRRIGLMAAAEHHPPATERQAGWRAALGDYGIEVDGLLAKADYSVEGGRRALRYLMSLNGGRPTAVICGSDLMAIGVLQEAAAMGLRVPEDLSVVGFDGVAAGTWTHPPLTTVEHPFEEMAETTIQALTALIEDPDRTLPQFVFRPTLRVRASTGPPPAPAPTGA